MNHAAGVLSPLLTKRRQLGSGLVFGVVDNEVAQTVPGFRESATVPTAPLGASRVRAVTTFSRSLFPDNLYVRVIGKLAAEMLERVNGAPSHHD